MRGILSPRWQSLTFRGRLYTIAVVMLKRVLYILAFVFLSGMVQAASAAYHQLPKEVQNAVLRHVADLHQNTCFWEGMLTPCADRMYQGFGQRAVGGSCRYNLDHILKDQPYGGWLVKAEIDLVGDATKEVVWQLVKPDVADGAKFEELYVYAAGGRFLFPAPYQIFFSVKKGSTSHGEWRFVWQYRKMSGMGVDEWEVSEQGVTMRSCDTRAAIDWETGKSDTEILELILRRYTAMGLTKSGDTILPDTEEYRSLREGMKKKPLWNKVSPSPVVRHVAAVADVVANATPAWLTTDKPLDAALAEWNKKFPAALECTKLYSSGKILELLEQKH